MITPFQIGILVFLGVVLILTTILTIVLVKAIKKTSSVFDFINKIGKPTESLLSKSNEIGKTTLSIQKSAEAMVNEANKRAKLAEDKLTDILKIASDSEEKAKMAIKQREDYVRIIKDDKVLYPNYSLSWVDRTPKVDFTVTYECDVLEVSEKKAKIRPYSVSSTDKRFNDMSEDDKLSPTGVMRHIHEKWVDLNKLELIIDLGRS